MTIFDLMFIWGLSVLISGALLSNFFTFDKSMANKKSMRTLWFLVVGCGPFQTVSMTLDLIRGYNRFIDAGKPFGIIIDKGNK